MRLLRNLPAGTIDAVVAGHSHQIVHHWVAGVPVIEGGAFGRFFNVIYLSFDLKTRKLLGDLTQIEGPVSVCPKVFANQGDCNGERPAPKAGRGQLVAPKFHNKIVSQDTPSANLISSVLEKTAEIKKRVIVTASRPIEHERFKESALGDLFADAMIAASNADVAILNPGGIRSSWEQGPVTYESVFRSFPFEDSIVTVKVTGTELKTFLRIVESGARGFYSVSGIQLRLLHPDSDAPAQDLNDDGKVEAWEVNRILDARFLTDGKPINDSQEYTLALLDFLATGGDDLGWIMSQIPKDRIHHDPHTPPLRDAVIQYAQKLGEAGPLNSVERPIISATHPRLKFEKPAGKKGKARGSKKSRRKKH